MKTAEQYEAEIDKLKKQVEFFKKAGINLVEEKNQKCTCLAFHKSDECYKLGCKAHRV